MIIFITTLFFFLCAWWLILSCEKRCPNCGGRMDKAGNNYLCRDCHKLWYMNMFGRFKEE